MAVAFFSNRVVALEWTLAGSCAVMAWQLTSQVIDSYAKNLFSSYLKMLIQLSMAISVFIVSVDVPIIAFVVISIASAILSIRGARSAVVKLPSYMTDLVEAERKKEKCPYTGQEAYIDELGVVLCQKQRNNAILVGAPGTGKTAIIERIAWMIAHGQFPTNSPFNKRSVISLNLSDLVSGCSFVGMLEARIKEIHRYIDNHPESIIFVDEIHRIVGAGRSMNSMAGVADHLKPVLARAGVSFIGATTLEEHGRDIVPDGPLNRRFLPIFVKEPTPEQCLHMIKEVRKQRIYELEISDSAINTVLKCSELYRGHQPDKSMTLLDRACATARFARSSSLTNDHIYKACARDCKMELAAVQQRANSN